MDLLRVVSLDVGGKVDLRRISPDGLVDDIFGEHSDYSPRLDCSLVGEEYYYSENRRNAHV